jgi:hypothetical protein
MALAIRHCLLERCAILQELRKGRKRHETTLASTQRFVVLCRESSIAELDRKPYTPPV